MKKQQGKEALARMARVHTVKEIAGAEVEPPALYGFEITDENGAVYKITSESPIRVMQTCLPDPDYGD